MVSRHDHRNLVSIIETRVDCVTAEAIDGGVTAMFVVALFSDT